jgi:hypothetical protein
LKQLEKIDIYNTPVIATDPTFIKAYSKRDPKNNVVGYSDPEARLRKEGRNVTLGYGVHLAVVEKLGLWDEPIHYLVKSSNSLKVSTKRKRLAGAISYQANSKSLTNYGCDSALSSSARVRRITIVCLDHVTVGIGRGVPLFTL